MSADLVDEAVSLARRWVGEAAEVAVDPASKRLAGVLRDPDGLPFALGFVDGVMRPESRAAAAVELARVSPLAPRFLPWYLRGAIRAGGLVGPYAPFAVVPAARRALREMVGHLIVDARPDKLGAAIGRLRERGSRLNLNLLGEAVLGDGEAGRRLDGIHALVRRPDVDHVSVKVSAIAANLSMWAFDETVDLVVERLKPLYIAAAENGTFLNLDMEEYRDLDLTIAVFQRLLDDPRLHRVEAGIVLQAYLPDALPALERITHWATARVDGEGAPITVRLVKGANLAREHVESILHDWPMAPYATKVDTDANYLRLLDVALRPERIRAVRIGVAGHNLFHIAYAWLLAGDRGVRDGIGFEMLLGMAQGQVEAVSREVGPVLLYVPVVAPEEFDSAIGYLVRRLEENASSDNFLSAAFSLHDDPALFAREENRFLAALRRAGDDGLATGSFRSPQRGAVVAPDAPADVIVESVDEGLTSVVLDIARSPVDTGAIAETRPDPSGFDDGWVETAVFARREGGDHATGAPGFRNAADTDPAVAGNRAWARDILARVPGSTIGSETLAAAGVTAEDDLDAVVDRVRRAAESWGPLPAVDRAAVLRAAAAALEDSRAGLIEAAASETGKVLAEADSEVSEAVDFANYYAAIASELDRVPGAVFVPARVTVVAPPGNFPLAIPAGGVLAALAAGSGVVFKPSPQAGRCAAVVAEALWLAGVPRDLLVLIDLDEDALGRRLIEHAGVDRVILTGSRETAELFRSWRPTLPLVAETSGKNAIVVTPSADLDLAAADVVRSAFGHAGQKCSAASLVILVGSVGRSRRFARQLVDATRSLRVGDPADPLSEIGPLIQAPVGKLDWALSTLEAGESWLVEPRPVDGADGDRRFWTPGIRIGVREGSRFHREEFFGPVLGVMHATSLDHAIEIQNAVDYGLTAGIHTRDPDELAVWLERVEAGNLYVNRGTTGAVVQRQPFGGWKRSSVGPGAAAGGPNHLVWLGSWRATSGGPVSQSLHLRGLDTRIAALIESAQPSLTYDEFEWLRRGALSDAIAWDREFGRVKDVSHLGVERNLFRYRPVPVAIRATTDAAWEQVLRVVIAALRAGERFTLSTADGIPATVRRALGDLDVAVSVESDDEWLERMAAHAPEPEPETGAIPTAEQVLGIEHDRPQRVRIIGRADGRDRLAAALAEATKGDPDLAVYAGDVTTAGRLELLPFLREQAISLTAHRFGNPDPTFADVI